jgi:hypothetical protein
MDMFDYVKCVEGWTTMVCHINDPIYYKIITIVVYNMYLETMEAQCVLWIKLNGFMLK